jgi:hypothetical protein
MVIVTYSSNPNSDSVQLEGLPAVAISAIAGFLGNNDMLLMNAVSHEGCRLRIVYRVSFGFSHDSCWLFRYWKAPGSPLYVTLGPIK